MKIQCPCGAKYQIIVTPGMPPIQFVCANCGQDYSAFVNDLIRRESDETIPAAAPVESPQSPRLKISHATTPPPAPPMPGSQIPSRRNPEELFAAEKKFWRKTGAIFAVVVVAAVLFVGGWTWYAWYGAVPHTVFSVKFDEISHSGATFVVSNQMVLLHGGTLARYDLKTQKPVWSDELITKQQITDALKQEDDEEAKVEAQYGRPEYSSRELPELREKHTRIELEKELSLRVIGQNIWIVGENELSRYDWNNGKMVQQVAVTNGFGEFSQNAAAKSPGGGLPLTPYGDASQPLDPQKVNQQMQHLTTPGRIALPAIMGENLHQQQLFKEMESGNPRPPAKNSAPQLPKENFMTIPDGDNFLQFDSKLIKKNIVEREAMKATPKKSALDSGNIGVANEGDAINEQLNEMQRNNGGGMMTEDQSIYQVTVRKPDAPDATFTTNVVGEPQLLPLKTVNVITAGKTLIVLDKSNKELWQAELAYNLPPERGNFLDSSGGNSPTGAGPCVERDGALYVYDEATLSALDISNGNARWRLPSVGISGLFFDEKGDIYLSTSTASLDNIKYAKQIDLNNPTEGVLMKIEPQMGKILWSVKPHGNLAYLSGKYIYTLYEFDPGDSDERMNDAGILQPEFLRITRINPGNGKVLWEYTDDHAPVDVKFNANNIRIVYKKEVRFLHYLSF